MLSILCYIVVMKRLTTPDRFYVYAYLREDGTPYYIGKGCGRRIHVKHKHVPVPPPKRRVKLVVDVDEATSFRFEKQCIAYWGTKHDSSGILINLTKGGEGTSGLQFSDESRKQMSDSAKARGITSRAQYDALMAWAHGPRKPLTEAHKQTLSEGKQGVQPAHLIGVKGFAGKKHTAEAIERTAAAHRGKIISAKTRALQSKAAANRSAEHTKKITTALQVKAAKKYGVDVEWYLFLSAKDKRKLCNRYSYGHRGDVLVRPWAA